MVTPPPLTGTCAQPSGHRLSGTPADGVAKPSDRSTGALPSPARPAASDDPDAVNLPPGVVLPDRDEYRAGQLRAQWFNSVIALVIVAIFWLTTTQYRSALGAVTAAVAFYFVLNFVRYQRALSKLRMKADRTDRDE